MNELVIYDMSAMVYYGGSHKEDFFGYPVGGIRYFLNHLAVDLVSRDCIVPCFDSPSFRTGLSTGYKSGREKRPAIYSQIETLYEGLQQCGIKCEKYDGYEADDIVEWAVAQNVEKFIRGVTIYCNDMDLCHSIRNGVLLRTLSPSMNDILPTNFETGIYRGKKIPYNTISAYKVFCGCGSDKIPQLKLKSGHGGYELFMFWSSFMGKKVQLSDRRYGANPELVRVFARKSGLFTPEEIEDVEKRIKLIYPAEVPDGVVITPTEWKDVDKERLESFMSLYGAREALRCLKMRGYSISDDEKQFLMNRAKMLKSGAYAVDHNLEYNTKSVRSQTIDLDAFTRGF